MKLSFKLPLAFAVALLLALGASSFGIYSLKQSLIDYATTVRIGSESAYITKSVESAFKTQVQEWKNVLVRGKDEKDLEKHWSAFIKAEREVEESAKRLLSMLPEGDEKLLVEKFITAHASMGQGYRKAFEEFKAADFDSAVGDKAVRGMDREPAKLLDEAGGKLSAASAAVATQTDSESTRATIVSLALVSVTFILSVVGAVFFSRTITRQLGGEPETAVALAKAVGQGDLTVRIDLAPGDTDSLMAHLKAMQDSLVNVVSEVRRNAESVATASAQISMGNADLSQRTEQQASALQQTSATMEQLGTTVRQNADNAKQANHLAQAASGVAITGGEVVSQVVETMRGISESSKKISDIIGTIDSIAFQTNILALNAAVESARAGEQGRGFAVVASEVRSLAQRSAEAAKEISILINASAARVEQGTALVDQAGQTMGELVDSTRRVTNIMGEISSASAEQSDGVTQVGLAVNQMDQATQQNAALVEQSAAAAESLNTQASTLLQLVSMFKLADDASRMPVQAEPNGYAR